MYGPFGQLWVKTNLSISEQLLLVDFSNFWDQKKKKISVHNKKLHNISFTKKTHCFGIFLKKNNLSDSLNCECKRESGFIDSLYIDWDLTKT